MKLPGAAYDQFAAHALGDSGRAREATLFRLPAELSETELQAHWFAGDFGRRFTAVDGVVVEVVSPGVWNHEAGPDFTGATIRVGNEHRTGAVEVDTDVRDWEHHGHATNPAYEEVVLHVFLTQPEARYFTRTLRGRNIPQVQLRPELLDSPTPLWLPEARPGRCSAPLRDMGVEAACVLLEAAGAHRLERKRQRILRAAESHGMDEALYHAVAAGLGYRENKLPFELIAQRLPLGRLRKARSAESSALLFGLAGFLREPDLARLPEDSRSYVRGLWESWWVMRGQFERLTLAKEQWTLSGLRPANHPQRRLAALAQIGRRWRAFRAAVDLASPEKFRAFFKELNDPFWDHHYTLTSKRSDKSLALVGESRAADLETNIFYPLAIGSDPAHFEVFKRLTARQISRRAATAATRLFGAGPTPFLHTSARQQGLLQIYEDFCLKDDSDCARCPFPKLLAGA